MIPACRTSPSDVPKNIDIDADLYHYLDFDYIPLIVSDEIVVI
jgi:hypothetical protein